MTTNRPPALANARAPGFTQGEFRSALGSFATGVTIVTAVGADGVRVGLTANSFNAVSLAPPLVLWSLAQSASTMQTFADGTHYAINVLAADQRAVAERFAHKGVDRFDGVAFHTGACGAPLLDGAIATFECHNRSQYVEGDHVIFVGEVEHCHLRPNTQPLIFHGGRFYTELPL